MKAALLRGRRRRKFERGTTVVVVVMVTTLLTAIGIFAVRAISQIDLAVGYSRQAAQTIALAEYGTSAAMAQLNSGASEAYVTQMVSKPENCDANFGIANAPCYRLFRGEIDAQTQALSSETLLEPSASSEPGSFGIPTITGDFEVEVTEPGPTGRPVAGTDLGGVGTAFKYVKVALTTTAQVRPDVPGSDPNLCQAGISSVASKQALRARVVVGPIAQAN